MVVDGSIGTLNTHFISQCQALPLCGWTCAPLTTVGLFLQKIQRVLLTASHGNGDWPILIFIAGQWEQTTLWRNNSHRRVATHEQCTGCLAMHQKKFRGFQRSAYPFSTYTRSLSLDDANTAAVTWNRSNVVQNTHEAQSSIVMHPLNRGGTTLSRQMGNKWHTGMIVCIGAGSEGTHKWKNWFDKDYSPT
jgi:hypothetical protein